MGKASTIATIAITTIIPTTMITYSPLVNP